MEEENGLDAFGDAVVYSGSPELMRLHELIDSLPLLHQIAFALCCCERSYPYYKSFVHFRSRPDVLRPLLDRLWNHVKGYSLSELEIASLLRECNLIDTGEDDTDESMYASRAVSTVCSTLRSFLSRTSHYSVMSCVYCQDIVYQRLWNQYFPDSGQIQCIDPDELRGRHARIDADPDTIREVAVRDNQLRLLMEYENVTDDLIVRLLRANGSLDNRE